MTRDYYKATTGFVAAWTRGRHLGPDRCGRIPDEITEAPQTADRRQGIDAAGTEGMAASVGSG